MSETKSIRERGQTLVILALSLTVLMLMAGLAVDVGMAYNERRDMQNAADAGALYGAQLWCDGVTDVAVIQAAAKDVAVRLNGADPDMTVATSTAGSFRVNVVAGVNSDTFFFRLVGIDQVPVEAEAESLCGCAESVGAPWPILFDEPSWGDMEDVACDDPPVNTYLMVWSGDVGFEWSDSICGLCNCEWAESHYGLPNDFFENMTSYGTEGTEAGDRGWARLGAPEGYPGVPGNSCGNAALAEWLRVGYQGTIAENMCVPGQPGITWSNDVVDAIELHHGDEVSVMLFNDVVNIGACTIFPAGDTCTTGIEYYKVSGFGCVRILSSDAGFSMPFAGSTNPTPKCKIGSTNVGGSVIFAQLVCDGCDWTGSGSPGDDPPFEGCIVAARLVK